MKSFLEGDRVNNLGILSGFLHNMVKKLKIEAISFMDAPIGPLLISISSD